MTGAGGTANVPSLPPPKPKSPPQYPDLYGKRRELARVQLLEREIGFLEDELKFVGGLQPASQSCKEIADFVVANSDPFIPTTKRARKSCRFWKWLCGGSCFSFSWICCSGCCRGCKGCPSCTPNLKLPNCCKPKCKNACQCTCCIPCSKPKCKSSCCSCPGSSQCCKMPSCNLTCCIPKCPSCSSSNCHCKGCTSCYPKCLKLNLCSCSCTKNCCCCFRCCFTCF